jgi:hypothetical protein
MRDLAPPACACMRSAVRTVDPEEEEQVLDVDLACARTARHLTSAARPLARACDAFGVFRPSLPSKIGVFWPSSRNEVQLSPNASHACRCACALPPTVPVEVGPERDGRVLDAKRAEEFQEVLDSDVVVAADCPRRKPPFSAVKRPARP